MRPLNAWIWLADERSKVCNIFRETHGERSSRQVLTTLYVHFTSTNDELFQRSLQPKTAKEPETGQTNKYSKQ